MKVKILYFASLREQLGSSGEELELPAGVDSLAALHALLLARGGVWQAALGGGKLVRMAVNQEIVPASSAVRGGDEVAFFPPVTGG